MTDKLYDRLEILHQNKLIYFSFFGTFFLKSCESCLIWLVVGQEYSQKVGSDKVLYGPVGVYMVWILTSRI